MKSRIVGLLFVALALVSAIAFTVGCSDGREGSTGERVSDLRVGVLNLVSALPVFVAEKEGYFDSEGLSVELITFNSALEQDAALQAGKIDGYFSDPVNTIVMINGGVDISIVNTPYRANARDRMFAIMVPAKSQIDNIEGLKGVEVAISSATIIEYLQDKMLQRSGFAEEDIAGQDVRQIPIRLQMLLAGQVKAALLPETLVSLAERSGARVIVDDTVLDLSETVIALSNALMERDSTLKGRFLNGLERATRKINGESGSYHAALLADINVPPDVRNSYRVPVFPVNAVPSARELDEIQAWLFEKGIIKDKILYAKIVK